MEIGCTACLERAGQVLMIAGTVDPASERHSQSALYWRGSDGAQHCPGQLAALDGIGNWHVMTCHRVQSRIRIQ